MSQEGKEEKPVGIAEALGRKCVEWTDRTGRRHSLPTLVFSDWAEIEDEFGPVDTWAQPKNACGRMWGAAIWRSMRREGLSRADVLAAKWTLRFEHACELVPVGTGTFEAEDAFGTVQTFHPLTLLDLVLAEKDFGPSVEWVPPFPVRMVLRLVWLSLRKQGKPPELVATGDAAMTEKEASVLFPPQVASREEFARILDRDRISGVQKLWADLLAGSGIAVRAAAESQASDPQPAAPTGAA